MGRPIYATWGNHDFIGQKSSMFVALVGALPENVSILVDEAHTINGVKVWFSLWSNLFGDWAFMEVESDLKRRYARIPEDTQIIVSHGPPKGYGDRIFWDRHYQNVGSTSLLDRFAGLPNCSTLVCGHIHEAAGTYLIPGLPKQVINCSQVDEQYQPVHGAVRILEVETAPSYRTLVTI